MMGLHLPHSAPWASALVSECLKFPTGANDDIVDTLSLIGRMVAGLEKGVVEEPQRQLSEGEMTLNQLIELEESHRWQ